MDRTRYGGCNCGAVRFECKGEPVRVGLCHCAVCRKETGSAFMVFAVWRNDDVTVTGVVNEWSAGTDRRRFCSTCGSAIYATTDGAGEVEIRLGALDDAPTDLVPTYESFVPRREVWLHPIEHAAQFSKNRY